VVSEGSLSLFSDVAWSNRWRIRRAWLISPWIGTSESKRDPLAHLVEALRKCQHFWLVTRPPKESWHPSALRILRANSRPSVLLNPELHAKLYILECDGFKYALLGSPNLTPRANAVNRELAIQFKSSVSSREDKIAAVIEDLIDYARFLLQDPKSRL